MKAVNQFLSDLPLGTISFLAVLAAGFYCLIDGSITYEEFGLAVGAGGVGSAAIGHVRNQVGKGTRRH